MSECQLQFTAFHPGAVPVETWNTLLVYAYIESALQAIRADAYKFKDQLGPDPFKADAWASHPLTRGTQITVVPIFQGVTFNPERIAFAWVKDWHRAIFSFNADKRWAGVVGSGEIIVFAGPLIIASLKISLLFGKQSFQDNLNQEEVSAFRYRKIFTSYSHIDTPIVSTIRKAYEAIGDDSFLDIENLRSGQNWNAALLRMIDNSDIFILPTMNYQKYSRKLIRFWLRQLLPWLDGISCRSHSSTILRSSFVTLRAIVPTTSVSIPP